MARRKIIAGNWKMNMTPTEAVALVETLKPLVKTEEADVVFCVPAIDIIPVVKACEGTNIMVMAASVRTNLEWKTLCSRGVIGGQGEFFASPKKIPTSQEKNTGRYRHF